MSKPTGQEKEINLSDILGQNTYNKISSLGDIKIYVKVNYGTNEVNLSLIATKSKSQVNGLQFINDINKFRKIQKYIDIIQEVRKIENQDLNGQASPSSDEEIIGFCLYDIDGILIRNNELYVKVYLNSLWSYIKKGGIGKFLMYYGYELIKYYINYNKNYRKEILEILNKKDIDFFPQDKLGQENLSNLKFNSSNYYDTESVKLIKENYSKSIDLKIKFAYTFHDSSNKYNIKDKSFYNFIIEQLDVNNRTGLIWSDTRYTTNNNSYKIEQMDARSIIKAYYAFDSDWKSRIDANIHLPNMTIRYTNKKINGLNTLYRYSESAYPRFRSERDRERAQKNKTL